MAFVCVQRGDAVEVEWPVVVVEQDEVVEVERRVEVVVPCSGNRFAECFTLLGVYVEVVARVVIGWVDHCDCEGWELRSQVEVVLGSAAGFCGRALCWCACCG